MWAFHSDMEKFCLNAPIIIRILILELTSYHLVTANLEVHSSHSSEASGDKKVRALISPPGPPAEAPRTSLITAQYLMAVEKILSNSLS